METKICTTKIQDLVELYSESFKDERGLFLNAYRSCEPGFKSLWKSRKIAQVNISLTRSVGSIRGLHYQLPPYEEAKLVRCLKGKVWDVAVDLRKKSKTYRCWHAVELSPELSNAILIPEGFAHGFQVLSPNSELLYIHSNIWVKEFERGIRFDSPHLGINWPLKPEAMSNRDLTLPLYIT